MNDEHSVPSPSRPSLDARFAARPHTRARLHALADLMDAALARGATADEAEAITAAELRSLGAELLTDWARAQHDASLAAARTAHPAVSLDAKKNWSGSPPSARCKSTNRSCAWAGTARGGGI